jgi:23S rRNA (adenine2030-N6)-methyltransferase
VANTYAANFGDVVKHAVLCEVIIRERPRRYLESHGGRLYYELGDLVPGPGGVWDFLEEASESDVLDSSAYAISLRREVGTRNDPGRYPGSIALAAEWLPVASDVVAFELVTASATELSEGLVAMGRSATVEVGDGLAGVCELARSGDLVLLDPFHVHERGDAFSSVDAFCVLATRGVRTVLWYAIYDPSESNEWIADTISSAVPRGWSARVIGDSTEGGLAGCGFLTAHLSPESETAAGSIVEALARALSRVRPGLRVD